MCSMAISRDNCRWLQPVLRHHLNLCYSKRRRIASLCFSHFDCRRSSSAWTTWTWFGASMTTIVLRWPPANRPNRSGSIRNCMHSNRDYRFCPAIVSIPNRNFVRCWIWVTRPMPGHRRCSQVARKMSNDGDPSQVAKMHSRLRPSQSCSLNSSLSASRWIVRVSGFVRTPHHFSPRNKNQILFLAFESIRFRFVYEIKCWREFRMSFITLQMKRCRFFLEEFQFKSCSWRTTQPHQFHYALRMTFVHIHSQSHAVTAGWLTHALNSSTNDCSANSVFRKCINRNMFSYFILVCARLRACNVCAGSCKPNSRKSLISIDLSIVHFFFTSFDSHLSSIQFSSFRFVFHFDEMSWFTHLCHVKSIYPQK